MKGSGSTTGRLSDDRPAPDRARITDLGVIGVAPHIAVEEARAAAVVAMYEGLAAAVREGRVTIECTVDPDGQTVLRAVAATAPTEPCPACRRAPISPGSLAPLGPAGVLVQVCTACSAVSRSVDAALRADPMREVDR